MEAVLNTVFLLYFITHIPITIFVDSQSVFPQEYYPTWAREALQWHIKVNKDHLVRDNPVWFVSCVYCETFLQLPFFFVATYAFLYRKKWIRIPGLIYAVHVITTMVPILGDILFSQHTGKHTPALAAVYMPYLVVPVLLVVRLAMMQDPFPAKIKTA